MRFARPLALSGAVAWLLLTGAVGAAAAPSTVDLGGADLPSAGSVTDQADPVVLTAGLWADRLGGAGSNQDQHYFRYERRIADSTVHIGVVGAPTSEATGSDGIGVSVTTGDTSCGSDTASGSSYTSQAVLGVAVAVDSDAPDERDDACLGAPTLDIAVDRSYSSSDLDLPIALKIVEEAPVTGAAELPAAVEDEDVRETSPSSSSADLPGAASFTDAPALDPDPSGVTISTTLAEGDIALWRVPVGWGERLSARVDIAAHDDGDEDATFYGPDVDLRLIGPMRETSAVAVEDGTSYGSHGEEAVQLTAGTPATRYLNRYGSVTSPALPGEHWIEVAVSPQDETTDADGEEVAPIEVPIELTVAVAAAPGGAGVPTYAATVQAPGAAAGPSGYDPATPFLVGADEFSAVASDAAVLPGDEDGGYWGARRYAGVGLAVLSLACCGAGLWLIRARAAAR